MKQKRICVGLLIFIIIIISLFHLDVIQIKICKIDFKKSIILDAEKREDLILNTTDNWKCLGEKLAPNSRDNFAVRRNETSWSLDDEIHATNESFEKLTLRSPFGINCAIYTYKYKFPNEHVGVTYGIGNDGVWERQSVEAIYHALSTDKDLVLIDVGANVGVFTLSAAMIGRKVIAIEPVLDNAKRLYKSILEGHFENEVYLIHNAASNSHRLLTFINVRGENSNAQVDRLSRNKSPATSAYSVLLDDLLEVFPIKKAVIKIDVESHEAHVLKGAEHFLQHVHVPFILLEWILVKNRSVAKYILQLMRRHNMQPLDVLHYYQQLDVDRYKEWPEAILWRKAER